MLNLDTNSNIHLKAPINGYIVALLFCLRELTIKKCNAQATITSTMQFYQNGFTVQLCNLEFDYNIIENELYRLSLIDYLQTFSRHLILLRQEYLYLYLLNF